MILNFSDKLSTDQLEAIRGQMKNYFQITVQAYALQKELSGRDDKKTVYWQTELVCPI
jgi:hypothetical protein